MSANSADMLTRCSACGTAFRITTDQLVMRQGMVRCGQCNEVFNALEHLAPRTDAAPSQERAAATEAITADASSAAWSASPVEDVAPASSYDLFGAAPAPDAGTVAAAPTVLSPLLAPESPRRFPWLSLIGSMLAIGVLLAQATWFYRNQIAAKFPDAKPYLEAACAQLDCRIEPPVDPQAISIESSDLQAEPGSRSVLVLSAVLRNRASFDQDLPLLELALTDAQDAALARRVLKPADYAPGTRKASIAAGAEHQVRLYIDAGQLKANGYRLYAFYP